ncbi:hypothetical protein [Microcoleus sp. CAWBG640]|uniref:hypothetical protein n=1 Tax=Microcoleus sp. CAWBG640 TaxID=2841653 RepID=UPI00312B3263
MTRLAFMVGYKSQDPSEEPPDAPKENLLGYFTCTDRVAKFLKIETLFAKAVERDRKGYTKSIIKADGTTADKVVNAGKIMSLPSTKSRSRAVVLRTGAKAKKTKRTITVTFPSNMTVAQIGEALAEYIPDTVIQRTTGNPSATEIYAQYSIKGGRTYPIPLKAAAEASPEVDAPATDAEQATVAARPR